MVDFMDYSCSKSIGGILEKLPESGEIDLIRLAQEVAVFFEKEEATAGALLIHCRGHIASATLIRYLHDCIVYDSVVRDFLTIGHLAKLLSRVDIFEQTSNPQIVGFPNKFFDKYSLQERAEFFARGGILFVEGELLRMPAVNEMLERENQLGQ
jgi:hypothetical protein